MRHLVEKAAKLASREIAPVASANLLARFFLSCANGQDLVRKAANQSHDLLPIGNVCTPQFLRGNRRPCPHLGHASKSFFGGFWCNNGPQQK